MRDFLITYVLLGGIVGVVLLTLEVYNGCYKHGEFDFFPVPISIDCSIKAPDNGEQD